VKPEETRPLAKQRCNWEEKSNKDFLVAAMNNQRKTLLTEIP
jgi:hypothetical protein